MQVRHALSSRHSGTDGRIPGLEFQLEFKESTANRAQMARVRQPGARGLVG
jgi:hypothetical protein